MLADRTIQKRKEKSDVGRPAEDLFLAKARPCGPRRTHRIRSFTRRKTGQLGAKGKGDTVLSATI